MPAKKSMCGRRGCINSVDNGDVMQCDSCSKWFDKNCTGLSVKQYLKISKNDIPYCCMSCITTFSPNIHQEVSSAKKALNSSPISSQPMPNVINAPSPMSGQVVHVHLTPQPLAATPKNAILNVPLIPKPKPIRHHPIHFPAQSKANLYQRIYSFHSPAPTNTFHH